MDPQGRPRPLVMGFDLASQCGVAWGRPGERPLSLTMRPVSGKGDAPRLAGILETTERLLKEHRPDLVAYEMPVGGPKTSHSLVMVIGAFVGQVARMGITPEGVSVPTVRKHFLGRALVLADFPTLTKADAREAIKTAVIRRCGVLGWSPNNDDEADAMAVWDWACAARARAQVAPLGDLFGVKRHPQGPGNARLTR